MELLDEMGLSMDRLTKQIPPTSNRRAASDPETGKRSHRQRLHTARQSTQAANSYQHPTIRKRGATRIAQPKTQAEVFHLGLKGREKPRNGGGGGGPNEG